MKSTANVDVQPGMQVQVDKIVCDVLTLGAGTTVTITPIPGGPLGVNDSNMTMSEALATGTVNPVADKTEMHDAAADTVEQTLAITTGMLAARVVLAAEPVVDSGEMAIRAESSSSLLSETALTPKPFSGANQSFVGRGDNVTLSAVGRGGNVILSVKGRGDMTLETLNISLDALAVQKAIVGEKARPIRLQETTFPAKMTDTISNRVPLAHTPAVGRFI